MTAGPGAPPPRGDDPPAGPARLARRPIGDRLPVLRPGGRAGRQLLRGVPDRAGPVGGQRRRERARRPVPVLRGPGRHRCVLRVVRPQAAPAAITSNSTWTWWPGSPTAACGTAGTRTRWCWPPPSGPAARWWWRWSVTGCPPPTARTRRRWPRPRRPGMCCWPRRAAARTWPRPRLRRCGPRSWPWPGWPGWWTTGRPRTCR